MRTDISTVLFPAALRRSFLFPAEGTARNISGPGPGDWSDLQELLDQQQLEKAAGMLDRLLARYPEDADLWIQRGNLFWREQRNAEAEMAYRKAARLDPHSAPACWCLVLLYRDAGRQEEAREWYARARQHSRGWFGEAVRSLRLP